MYVRVAEITSQSSLQFKMLMAFIENEFLNKKDSNQCEETFSLLKFKYNPTSNSSIKTTLVYADAKGAATQLLRRCLFRASCWWQL